VCRKSNRKKNYTEAIKVGEKCINNGKDLKMEVRIFFEEGYKEQGF
jgi:hypothetical protein